MGLGKPTNEVGEGDQGKSRKISIFAIGEKTKQKHLFCMRKGFGLEGKYSLRYLSHLSKVKALYFLINLYKYFSKSILLPQNFYFSCKTKPSFRYNYKCSSV